MKDPKSIVKKTIQINNTYYTYFKGIFTFFMLNIVNLNNYKTFISKYKFENKIITMKDLKILSMQLY